MLSFLLEGIVEHAGRCAPGPEDVAVFGHGGAFSAQGWQVHNDWPTRLLWDLSGAGAPSLKQGLNVDLDAVPMSIWTLHQC